MSQYTINFGMMRDHAEAAFNEEIPFNLDGVTIVTDWDNWFDWGVFDGDYNGETDEYDLPEETHMVLYTERPQYAARLVFNRFKDVLLSRYYEYLSPDAFIIVCDDDGNQVEESSIFEAS